MDDAFGEDNQQGGIGVVCRDKDGKCVAAFARPISHALSALLVKAEACRAGLHIAIYQEWFNVDFESDCAALVNALTHNSLDCSTIGQIMKDCIEYMSHPDLLSDKRLNSLKS